MQLIKKASVAAIVSLSLLTGTNSFAGVINPVKTWKQLVAGAKTSATLQRIVKFKKIAEGAGGNVTTITLTFNNVEVLEVASLYPQGRKFFSAMELDLKSVNIPYGYQAGKNAGLDTEQNYKALNKLGFAIYEIVQSFRKAAQRGDVSLETLRVDAWAPIDGTLVNVTQQSRDIEVGGQQAKEITDYLMSRVNDPDTLRQSTREIEEVNKLLAGGGEFALKVETRPAKTLATDGL